MFRVFNEIKKIIIYGANGIINTVITYFVFIVVSQSIDYRITVLLAYLPGICTSYFLNGRFVFRRRGRPIIFFVVMSIMMISNLVITWILVENFLIIKEISQIMAILITFVLGYLLNKKYAFG